MNIVILLSEKTTLHFKTIDQELYQGENNAW